jgi:hypothetical protein
MAFVNQVLDLQSTELDAFARFTNMRHGLCCRFVPPGNGAFLLRKRFEGACDYLFGRVVAASAEVRRDQLFAVGIESESQGHSLV